MSETLQYWKDYLWSSFAAKRQRDLFKDIHTYCMFIGYGRSGHSLYGAMLNAHPQMVIAHELNALLYVERGISREQLYALILKRDRWFSDMGNRWEGYNYTIPNQWQGRFERLKVIGDKRGAGSTRRLGRSPQLLSKLRSLVGVPLRIIHIVRNPYDNIATVALRQKRRLANRRDYYFKLSDTNAQLLKALDPSEVVTLRHEDIIARPKELLKQMVDFVGLQADEAYLSDCASLVFKSPSKSRFKAHWNDQLISAIQSRIDQQPFLQGYTFES